MSSKLQEIYRRWVKNEWFSAHPRRLFAGSPSVSQKNWPHCRKEKEAAQSFSGQFLWKPRQSRVSLGARRVGNVVQDQGNRAQVGQEQTVLSAPSAPFCRITISKSKKTGHTAQSQRSASPSLGHFSENQGHHELV